MSEDNCINTIKLDWLPVPVKEVIDVVQKASPGLSDVMALYVGAEGLLMMQNELRAENEALKAENAQLKGLLIRIENAARLAENGLMATYRFPMWIRAAIEKALVKP